MLMVLPKLIVAALETLLIFTLKMLLMVPKCASPLYTGLMLGRLLDSQFGSSSLAGEFVKADFQNPPAVACTGVVFGHGGS